MLQSYYSIKYVMNERVKCNSFEVQTNLMFLMAQITTQG